VALPPGSRQSQRSRCWGSRCAHAEKGVAAAEAGGGATLSPVRQHQGCSLQKRHAAKRRFVMHIAEMSDSAMHDGYHASRVAHKPGKHLVGGVRTFTGLQAEVENILEDARPASCCSRITGLFATDDPAHAEKFLMAEPYEGNAPIRIFKVSVAAGETHPLVLADRLARLRDDPRASEIVAEYWQPTRTWRFTERVVFSMHILEEVPRAGIIDATAASMTHAGDLNRAVALWP
jgi:hypothetical protein